MVRVIPLDEETEKLPADLLPSTAATTTQLGTKLAKPSTPGAAAAVTIATDGTVSTTPLSGLATTTDLGTKLAKPANPGAPAVPVIATDGTVTTTPLSGLGGGGGATLNETGDYETGTAYAVGDLFTYLDVRYVVLAAFTGGATPDLAKAAPLGPDPAATVQVIVEETQVSYPLEVDGVPGFVVCPGTWVAAADPGFDPSKVTNQWSRATMPTTKTASWDGTVGSVPLAYAASLNGASTGYSAGAFNTKGGMVLENDERWADVGDDPDGTAGAGWDLDPGSGWGCAFVVLENFGPIAVTDGANMIALSLYHAGFAGNAVAQVRLVMSDGSPKTYSWIVRMDGEADVVVPVGSLPGLDTVTQRVTQPTSIALLLKGNASYLSVNGVQKGGALPLGGKTARIYDVRPDGPTGLERGVETVWGGGYTTFGHANAAAAEAWVAAELAAAQAAP